MKNILFLDKIWQWEFQLNLKNYFVVVKKEKKCWFNFVKGEWNRFMGKHINKGKDENLKI